MLIGVPASSWWGGLSSGVVESRIGPSGSAPRYRWTARRCTCRSCVGNSQPGRKVNRTVRIGLSPLVSTRQIDCQVPSASCPPSTGTLA